MTKMMNHDDVIRLAKEAGLYVGKNASGVTLIGHKYRRFDNTGMLVHMDVNDMARFAALVAAAEREACAAICDEEAKWASGVGDLNGAGAAVECGYKIRSRGRSDDCLS